MAGRVRLYCPYGRLIPGMAYLVRRLLENTANESFLRQSFADGAAVELLMENPAVTLERELAARQEKAPPNEEGPFPPFRNEPPVDFTIPEKRKAYAQGIAAVRAAEGRTLPLYIDGKDVATETLLPTVNPADPGEVLAQVCQAGRKRSTAPLPGPRPPSPRGATPRRWNARSTCTRPLPWPGGVSTKWRRSRRWRSASLGNRLTATWARASTSSNTTPATCPPQRAPAHGPRARRAQRPVLQPKGVAAVIAPWNFPSPLRWAWFRPQSSPATRWCSSLRPCPRPSATILWKSSRKWGSPPGLQLLPRPELSHGRLSGGTPGHQPHLLYRFDGRGPAHRGKGGQRCSRASGRSSGSSRKWAAKNATIVDDDADLDEAVSQVVYSAFGFQGQKCSACSRVIVLDAIYDTFVQRLALAAQSLRIGPAENPENFLGPLADASCKKNVLEYIKIAEAEGRRSSSVPICRTRARMCRC